MLLCFRPLWILLLFSSIKKASVSSVLDAAQIVLLAHWYELSPDDTSWLIIKHLHAFKQLSVLVVILKFLLVLLRWYQLVSCSLITPLISQIKIHG